MAYSYDGYLRFGTKVDQSGFDKGVNSLKSAASVGAKAVAVSLGAATGEVTALSVASIRAGSNFEEGMSKVSAISGATASDLQALADKAKEMGATTKFSATQSAEALQYMAMAGWKTEQMLEGLPGIMNLAAASGEDLASVSDIVTDAMTAFGLKAEESGRFADVLAAASSNANTNVGMMGATFKYVAPVAGSLGYNIEDMAVAIGLMANAGIKGEMAGTQLRATLTRLANPTKDSAAAMDALGMSLTNNDGTMKSFDAIIRDLRNGMAGLTEEQQATYAAMLGGQEAMSGLLAIANASEEDFNKLSSAIDNSAGAAEKMAKTANDNLKGDLTILGSTAESVGIQMYEKFQVPMRNAAKAATDSLGDVLQSLNSGQLDKSVDKIADATGNLLTKTAELAASGLPKLLNGFTYVIDHGKELTSVIAGATTAFVGYKVAVKAAKIIDELTTVATIALTAAQATGTVTTTLGTKAWVLFNAAVAANPIGLAAVALGALAAGLIYYNQVQNEATAKTEAMTKATYDKIEAWEESKKTGMESIQAQISELETTKEMIEELERLTDANGKVGDNKERVAYLTEKINEILPDSIKWIDDETVSIDNNIESLKRQIELKQASILLDEMEAEAVEARQKRTESLDRQLELNEEIARQEEEIEKLRTDLARGFSNARITMLQQEITEKEKQLESTSKTLDEEKALFEDYAQTIDDTSKLSIAIQKEDYEEVGRIMAQKDLQLKAAGDSTREELEKQISDLQERYNLLSKNQGENTSESIKKFTEEIKEQLDEYKAELDRRTPDIEKKMNENGEFVGVGFANGLITPYVLNKIQQSSNILGDAADKGVRARLQIKSPSRVAMVTGGFYTDGLAVGMVKNKDKMKAAVTELSNDAIKTAKEKATSYKEIGSLYIDAMKDGIDSQTDKLLDQVEKIVDKQVETFGEKNKDAKADYSKAARELMETYKKALRKGADEAQTLVSEKIKGITEEAQKQYDEIIRQRERMQEKLSDFGELFTRNEDGEVQLENIEKQTDALEKYQEVLEKLQEKGISDGLLNEVLSMGVEDGTDFGEELLKKSDTTFERYNQAWTEKQELAKTVAQKFYADELETLDKNFTQKLDTALADIPTQCTNVGTDAIQGVIDGMNSQKEDAIQTARDIADAIIKELKRATETASPSKRAAREVGKPITQGVVKGMKDAYNPKEMERYADRMMADVGMAQSRAAAQSILNKNISNVWRTSTYNEGDFNPTFNIKNGDKETVRNLMKESEFYRRQRVKATGGA